MTDTSLISFLKCKIFGHKWGNIPNFCNRCGISGEYVNG